MSQPILITGGAQRLGLAIAQDLLAQSIPVIVTYRTLKPSVAELQQAGAKAIQADFSTQEGLERAIVEIRSLTNTLRGIIHNASDWDAESPNTPAETILDKMMRVHVHAPYQINLALEDLLLSTKETKDIINMTDFVQQSGSHKYIAYSASKAALHNLTLSFARKFGARVKVNSIAPALLMFNDWDSAEYRQRALKKSLLEKVPGPKEAVKAVNFLLNAEYVTGQTIHLDGGRHLLTP